MATGIGAKLACSMRYVMAQNEQQAAADIKIYSPILALLDYQYDDEQRRVRASLAGYERTASWQEGIGCYLDYAGFTERQRLHWPAAEAVIADWPQGYNGQQIDPVTATTARHHAGRKTTHPGPRHPRFISGA